MTRKKDNKGGKSNKMRASLTDLMRKLFEKNSDSSLTHKQVCTLLNLRENELRKLAFTVLQDLVASNYLKSVSHGIYQMNTSSQNFVEGYIEITARGAGFLIVEGEDKDVFIPPHGVNRALHGDRGSKSSYNRDL